jgi:hypothetical protein
LLKRRTGVKRELSSLRNSEPMVEEHVDRFCDPPKGKVGHMWSKQTGESPSVMKAPEAADQLSEEVCSDIPV